MAQIGLIIIFYTPCICKNLSSYSMWSLKSQVAIWDHKPVQKIMSDKFLESKDNHCGLLYYFTVYQMVYYQLTFHCLSDGV